MPRIARNHSAATWTTIALALAALIATNDAGRYVGAWIVTPDRAVVIAAATAACAAVAVVLALRTRDAALCVLAIVPLALAATRIVPDTVEPVGIAVAVLRHLVPVALGVAGVLVIRSASSSPRAISGLTVVVLAAAWTFCNLVRIGSIAFVVLQPVALLVAALVAAAPLLVRLAAILRAPRRAADAG
jgi:hypothetical protein